MHHFLKVPALFNWSLKHTLLPIPKLTIVKARNKTMHAYLSQLTFLLCYISNWSAWLLVQYLMLLKVLTVLLRLLKSLHRQISGEITYCMRETSLHRWAYGTIKFNHLARFQNARLDLEDAHMRDICWLLTKQKFRSYAQNSPPGEILTTTATFPIWNWRKTLVTCSVFRPTTRWTKQISSIEISATCNKVKYICVAIIDYS